MTPKRRPGAARDAPGETQEASSPPSRQERSWAQLAQKEPSGGLPETILDPPRAGVAPSGGRFWYSFLVSESIAKAGQWAKLDTPSTALPPCVTSTCGLVRRRTADQGVLIHV